MKFYQRVLVAVDGSPASLHALKEALRLGGEPTVMCVTPQASSMGPTAQAPGDSYWQEVQDQARAQAAALAQAAGISLNLLSDRGEPYERIVAAAERLGSDLVVVGLKGRDLPAAALMGSTTARVIGFSPVDVLVMPEHGGIGFGKILLPTDGSRYSQRAALRALEICAAYGSELEVLAVLDTPPGFVAEAPEVARDLLVRLEEVVAGVQARAQDRGIPCRAEVLHGATYRVIIEQAGREKAGLIVMGSHGRTGLKRLLMGSVTERVIGFAPCPVLVVKGKE